MRQYESNLALIRYHAWWPDDNDPYYRYNVPENTARTNYYDFIYVPYLFIDGIDHGYGYNTWGYHIGQETEVESPLVMEMWGTYNADSLLGDINIRVMVESDPGYSNYKLRVALTESNINWRAPNNGIWHHQTFRDMIPSVNGQAVSLTPGDTVDCSFRFNIPSPIVASNCYLVAFVQSDQNGSVIQGAKIGVARLTPVSVDDEPQQPGRMALGQNYPNPFNAQTTIDFTTVAGHVCLEIFDLTGANVVKYDYGILGTGTYSIVWHGCDRSGVQMPSGTYFYRLTDSSGSQTRRMTLLK
jgi:hypothetical protein